MDYKKKAIDCVKDTVLPIQRGQFEECGCSLDEQYKKYGNTEMLIARIIDPGHIYAQGTAFYIFYKIYYRTRIYKLK